MYKFGPADFNSFEHGDSKNWIIPNGLGGYCSHSIINSSHRKHHGYLIASLKPPVKRSLFLTRLNEMIFNKNGTIDLESQHLENDIKEGYRYLEEFTFDSVPCYKYRVGGLTFEKEISPMYGYNTVAISYKVKNGSQPNCFIISPLFNNREHGEISQRSDLSFSEDYRGDFIAIKSYKNKRIIIKMYHSDCIIEPISEEKRFVGPYHCEYDFSTGDERLDYHYNPFLLKFDLKPFEEKEISIVVTIEVDCNKDAFEIINSYKDRVKKLCIKSKLKDEMALNLVQAADVFICKRKSTRLKTILAGMPWFTDWGRDTMIAFTGLTLVTRRFKDAKEILKSFSLYEKNGLIPNMFPDKGSAPLYNTVDASLWYFYAVHKYIEYTNDVQFILTEIYPTLENIIKAYSTKTDFSIFMDDDYLVSSGSEFDQITWMDVRIGDICVTPRNGKAVEINALWYNALCIMDNLSKIKYGANFNEYEKLSQKVKKSFNKKFYCKNTNCLYDVVDPYDASIRPNQIWVLSLPYKVLDEKRAESVFNVVYEELFNFYGLRSLSNKDERFKPKYEGKLWNRDFAYHMGTTWAFLIGGFLDAYAYINKGSEECKKQIKKWVYDFEVHLKEGCINGVAEIFDGDYPSKTKGCYTQAWSVGELLRTYYENVLK